MENKVLELDSISKSIIKENDIELYNNIINYLDGGKWGVNLYHFINHIKDVPKCYCGTPLRFKSPKQGYREFCSTRCMYDSKSVKNKRRETCVEKYGVDNPSKSKDIRLKIENTNLKKYGETYPLKNKDVLSDMRDNFISKWGVDNPSKLPYVNEKRRKTMLSKYGVDSYPKHNDFIDKCKKSKSDRYGDKNFNNRDKFKKTMLERYDSTSYNNIESIKSTNLKLYGKEFYTQTDDYKTTMGKLTHEKNVTYFKENGIEFIKYISSDSVILKCDNCHNEYKITKQLFRKRKIEKEDFCIACNPIVYPKTENQVKKFLDEIGILYTENDKSILKGKEIDILIEERNIGIEFNGMYWHSDLFKDKDYHYNKMIKNGENGINLIQVWEDQWLYKNDIVKSMILNKLGKTDNKIFGRKCEIREVCSKESKPFLNDNHIQGNCNSSIKIGLYHNDELVSLMTFGSLRKNLGQVSKEGSFELLRFCNKLNTSVIGSFSKLLKHFTRNFKYNDIISYAMCDYSNGDIYDKIGFDKISYTGPNYFYFKNKKRYNRYNFRKDVLVREGFDETLTEKEIMMERGYNRIYDSGSIKYLYTKKEDINPLFH